MSSAASPVRAARAGGAPPRTPRLPGVLSGVVLLAASWAPPPQLAASESAEAYVLLDGTSRKASLLEIRDGRLLVEGAADGVPLYELSALVLGEPPAGAPPPADPALGPITVFRSGEQLAARVATANHRSAGIDLGTLRLEVPLESLRAFRLREAHDGDDLFEQDLKNADAIQRDTVYVRRGAGLLRVEGIFQGLDAELLSLEHSGQARKLKRQLVLGVILAPLAGKTAPEGVPAVVELARGGQIPGGLVGLGKGPEGSVLIQLPGAPRDRPLSLPRSEVLRVRLESDRVVFLSSLKPVKVEETPLVGVEPTLVWRKDRAAPGGPLLMAGKTYSRGLGMVSRSALEYDLQGKFATFQAILGLDDASGPQSGVLVRVIADGKSLLERAVSHGAPPEALSLPMTGVKRLRLEVDYGADGVDFGDYADWADARITK